MGFRRIALIGEGERALRAARAAREAVRDGSLGEIIAVERPGARSAAMARSTDAAVQAEGASAQAVAAAARAAGADSVWIASGSIEERAQLLAACEAAGLAPVGASAAAAARLTALDAVAAHLGIERAAEAPRTLSVHVCCEGELIHTLALSDRSVRRGGGPLIVESPFASLPAAVERAARELAIELCRLAGWRGAGAVRLGWDGGIRLTLVAFDPAPAGEAAVERVTGLDLLAVELGRGSALQAVARGHAITALLHAAPTSLAPAVLELLRLPAGPGIRTDPALHEGDTLGAGGEIAALTAYGRDRAEALSRLSRALAESAVLVRGGEPDAPLLRRLCAGAPLRAGPAGAAALAAAAAIRPDPQRAVLVAALEEAARDEDVEIERFVAEARRGRHAAGSPHTAPLELLAGGERFRLHVRRSGPDSFQVAAGSAPPVEVRWEKLGRLERRLSWPGGRARALVLRDEAVLDVELDGESFRVTRDPGGIVFAPFPAVVLQFPLGPGAEVREGQTVARLEAMKLEMPLPAPFSGRVRELFVAPNAQVGVGAPLLSIELQPGSAGQPARSLSLWQEPAARPEQPLAAAFDELLRLLLGYALDDACATLASTWKPLCERAASSWPKPARAELEALSAFADLQRLNQRTRTSSQRSFSEEWLQYLREPTALGRNLSPAFVVELRRALLHFGVRALAPGPVLYTALFRIWSAQERAGALVAPILRVLEVHLLAARPPEGEAAAEWGELLGRLATLGQPRFQPVADVARELRQRWFDEPALVRAREESWDQARRDVAALAAPDSLDSPTADSAAGTSAIIERLVESTQPLAGLFIAEAPSVPRQLRPRLVEMILRRYYRTRAPERVTAFTSGGFACARADCVADGVRRRAIACFAAADQVGEAAAVLARAAADTPPGLPLDLDFYLRDEGPRRDDDALAEELRTALASAGLSRPGLRAACAVTGPARGYGKAGQQHFSFLSVKGAFSEDRLCRGIHPMLAERLQLGRLCKFDLERLPSSEDVYLFYGRAQANPKDERLFAMAEVRDLTAERDAQGSVLRLPQLERMLHEALGGMRLFQARRAPGQRLEWNRVLLSVRPVIALSRQETHELVERIAPAAEGAGLEMVVLSGRMRDPASGELRDATIRIVSPERRGVRISFGEGTQRPLEPMGELQQKIISLRRRGLVHPFEIVQLLTPSVESAVADLPAGTFVEHDLDESGRLQPVLREPGKNSAHLVAGVISSTSARYPEGMQRVMLLGDPGKEMGSVAEPECRRIIAALDLAERLRVPLDWFTLSAGAKISMQSGTENMDWVSRALRRIVEFTQAGGEINVVVVGINVGAQPYWNAEATMLMHTRGILVMTPESAMVLTGKQALEYSGGVAAEDNQGIGGYDRIMGPNGQAQYWAPDLAAACRILVRHHEHCYVAPGERFPRRAATTDPHDRDVCLSPHGGPFATVGEVFSAAHNPERKKPFEIRRVMQAAIDADHAPLERWRDWLGGETAVVWDAHLGGRPVCLIGIESRTVPRASAPGDGPGHYTAGTLFPQSSQKIARSINAASGNRPIVVLANLSGFDGSPESMRRSQLEYGAEIGRAVINFKGPIVFCVVSRYHGGAFVVFSKTLREEMEIAAVEGAYASVIGGAPAAAVVFSREVEARMRKDPRVLAASGASGAERERAIVAVRSEKLGEVAAEYDRVHSIERALRVKSLDVIIAPRTLRPWLIDAVERGIARAQSPK